MVVKSGRDVQFSDGRFSKEMTVDGYPKFDIEYLDGGQSWYLFYLSSYTRAQRARSGIASISKSQLKPRT